MKKNEKGMALIVAIFVTIFLLFISMAFFTSSRNVANSSRQNWAGLVSSEIADGGAERAVWYVQKMLDSNPTWIPATSTESVSLRGIMIILLKIMGRNDINMQIMGLN